MNRRRVTTILSVALSLAVVLYVVGKLDWQSVGQIFRSLRWGWLGAALVVFIVNYVLRTLRFQALIYTQRMPFRQLMGVTSLYGMYNYLLPAKSGEFSYLYLLNRHWRLSLTEGTTTLFVARFFDFAAIALFLPAVLLVFWQRLPAWMVIASVIFCLFMYLATGLGMWFLRRHPPPAASSAQPANRWLARLVRYGRVLTDGLRLIDQRRRYWSLLFLTIGIWLCVYTNLYLIVLSIGYRLNYLQIIVISIVMVPMTLLPFQGFANLGTHEVGWVVAFTLFGYSEQVALSIAIGSHVVLLLFALILGGSGLVLTSVPALGRPTVLKKAEK
ncbi:MAG: flippase-like domain-containing protein [Chloroflexi bacterium]|nr:flippase-like domain-containing protein [Chloroflexota bacterium]MCI0645238.1 flippase-like domain-containing protein [Chloroflexota bacterium]MCI0725310.1 flippase-like domain-containing protein [Chloroflexota bacterium]